MTNAFVEWVKGMAVLLVMGALLYFGLIASPYEHSMHSELTYTELSK